MRTTRQRGQPWEQFLCSTVAYELALPLFLLNPFIAGFRVASLLARNTLLVVAVAAFKLIYNSRDQMSQSVLHVVVENAREAFVLHRNEADFGFNLWQFIGTDLVQFGVGLPYTAVKALLRYPHTQDFVFAAVVGATVAVLVFSVARIANPISCARCVTGLVLALAGYAIFLIKANVQFTLAGIGNRVSMMTVPGIAIALVGITGLIGTRLSYRSRPAVFAALLAVLCASGTLAMPL